MIFKPLRDKGRLNPAKTGSEIRPARSTKDGAIHPAKRWILVLGRSGAELVRATRRDKTTNPTKWDCSGF